MLPSGVKSNAPTCGSRARRVCTGRVLRRPLDGWPSGLRRTPGKRVCVKAYREFESHSIRCPVNDLGRWRDCCFWAQRTEGCGVVVDWCSVPTPWPREISGPDGLRGETAPQRSRGPRPLPLARQGTLNSRPEISWPVARNSVGRERLVRSERDADTAGCTGFRESRLRRRFGSCCATA